MRTIALLYEKEGFISKFDNGKTMPVIWRFSDPYDIKTTMICVRICRDSLCAPSLFDRETKRQS